MRLTEFGFLREASVNVSRLLSSVSAGVLQTSIKRSGVPLSASRLMAPERPPDAKAVSREVVQAHRLNAWPGCRLIRKPLLAPSVRGYFARATLTAFHSFALEKRFAFSNIVSADAPAARDLPLAPTEPFSGRPGVRSD